MKKWAKEQNSAFSKDEVQMAEKHIKKCSTSSSIREMQIKNMLRFHLTPVRMATIIDHKQQEMLAKMWRKRNPHTLLVGM
jgi:hypothetical protein